MISVIIIDDHPLVLSGFEFILESQDDIELAASFDNANSALDFLKTQHVDVVLADINMPNINGIDATSLIKKNYPNVHVIAISNLNERSIVFRMLEAGASGYLLKNVAASELVKAIRDVVRGQQVLSFEIKDVIHEEQGLIPKITQREQEVLQLMVQGKTTAKIAEEMFVSPLTVESHRRNLLQKFKVSNAASLIHKATEMKFI